MIGAKKGALARLWSLGFSMLLLIPAPAFAVAYFSNTATAAANWNAANAWRTGGCPVGNPLAGAAFPGSGAGGTTDTATICAGTTRTVTAAPANTIVSVTFVGGTTAANVNINTGVTLTVTGAVTMAAPTAAAVISSLTLAGTGTLNNTGGTISIAGSNAVASTARIQVVTGTVTTSGITITGGTAGVALTSLTTGTLTSTGGITLNGTAANAQLTSTGASNINVAGAFSNGGTLTHTLGTFNFNGTGAQTIPVATYNNLTISNARTGANNVTLANGGTINVAGNFSATATFGTGGYVTTNNTVNLTGGAAQNIGVVAPFTFNNLTVNKSASTATLTSAVTVGGTFTLTAGTLAVGANTLTLNSTVTTTGGALTSGATGTVNYAQGSNGQNVLVANYGNLTFSGFNKTLPAGTIGIATLFTPGAATGHSITGSTINFNGTRAQGVPAFSYNNLTISGARTVNNVTLVNGGTINVAGDFSATATFAGGGYVTTNNTVNINGSGAQNVGVVAPFTFNNLTVNKSANTATLTRRHRRRNVHTNETLASAQTR